MLFAAPKAALAKEPKNIFSRMELPCIKPIPANELRVVQMEKDNNL